MSVQPDGAAVAASFVRNAWYVLARSEQIARTPHALMVCGEPLVLYRTEAGQPVALQDRCPHRLVPLSLGRLLGDAIQCAYHGITFDCSGRCVHIPGDTRDPERLPAAFDVPAYLVREAHGYVWGWLGDTDLGRAASLPRYTGLLDSAGWESVYGYMPIQADVRLIVDNLLDLSHEATLHPNTIGNAAVGESPARTSVFDDRIEVERLMPDCAPPAMFARAAGFTGNIDRHQRVIFTPPSSVCVEVRATPAGEPDSPRRLEWYVHHLLTPETATSSHYHFALARSFALGREEVSEVLLKGAQQTIAEDHAMLEAQQRALALAPLESRRLHTPFDGAPTAGRKMVEKLLAREQQGG